MTAKHIQQNFVIEYEHGSCKYGTDIWAFDYEDAMATLKSIGDNGKIVGVGGFFDVNTMRRCSEPESDVVVV